ncbi:MAG: cellulase family glycosylhydrolase [Deltaproteobacteria bacterium]|nr:cellulase family glycosylhydrolase [Deltaproteobacteria bacterium]
MLRSGVVFSGIAACIVIALGCGTDKPGSTGSDTIPEGLPDAFSETTGADSPDSGHPAWAFDHPWTDGEFIRDEHGRVLTLRGVNVSNASKGAPFMPKWLGPESFQTIARAGFNVVRFLVFWEAVEPNEGEYDEDYLDRVEQAVDWAGEAGVRVLIDMHQDVWGRKYHEDGAPVWATMDDDIPFNPSGQWWLGYTQPAVIRAFDSFWDNRDGLRDKFVAMWTHVAKRFATNATVIGYDVFNEPFQGSFGSDEDFCEQGLNPLYDALIEAIRAVDTRHILFLEPSILTSIGTESCVAPSVTDGVVLAPHFYDPLAKIDWNYDLDPSRIEQAFTAFSASAARIGVPWFLGEWGFSISGKGSAEYYLDHMRLLDGGFVNWACYGFDKGGGMSLMGADGAPKWNLDILTRVFPRSVAGRPLDLREEEDGTVVFDFEPWPWVEAPTEVFVPDSRYPSGFRASFPAGEASQNSVPGGTLVTLRPEPRDPPGQARLTIEPVAPPSRFGLSSHVSTSDSAARSQELALDAEAGLRLIRRDFSWSHIEPAPGEFVFGGYDAVVDEAAGLGIEVLGLLDYGNPWAYGSPGNDSTLDPDAFAAFAGECADHFKGRVRYWEVWNEENIDRFWKPQPDPGAYGRLLKAASTAIRDRCPDCRVLFGGLAPGYMPGPYWLWGFLDLVYKAHPDLNRYFDILAIHPYTAAQMAAPEDDPMFGSLPQAIASARHILWAHGAAKPIWITEIGWPAAPEPPAGPMDKPLPNVSLDDQARFLVRGAVLAASAGVAATLLYTTFDGSALPYPTSEDFFGILQYDPDPASDPGPEKKPSWHAVRTMTGLLAGRPYVGAVTTSTPGVTAHRFGPSADSDEDMIVAWSPGTSKTTVKVLSHNGPPIVTGISGTPLSVQDAGDGFVVPVGPDPCYMMGKLSIQ